MSHTVVNLKEVDNLAARFGLEANLDVRLGRGPLGLENCGVSYQQLAPGFRVPFGHRHMHQEEVYVVVRGGARAKIDEQIVELGPWDAVRVPPGTMRQFEAGPEGAELIAVGAPPTGPEDDEVVHGWWAE